MIKYFLFIITIGLLPAYIYASGGFQIVDVPLALIIFYVLFFDKNIKYYWTIKYYIPFAVWSILIGLNYFTLDYNMSYLYSLFPILYAPFILYVFIKIFADIIESKLIYCIYFGIFLSILITFFVKGAPDENDRAILSFNDPNQLGYFAVLLAAYVILLSKYKTSFKLNNLLLIIFDIIILVLAHYFTILSVSRTALFILLIMDIYLIKYFKTAIGFSLTLIYILILIFFVFFKSSFIEQKLEVRPSKDYSQKGVLKDAEFRILHPLKQLKGYQFIIGKGQGQGMESHNFILELLRGYGMIGVALFLYWLIEAISTTKNIHECLFVWASLLLFNMGIYGLRWRGFWILLGFLFALAYSEKQKNNSKVFF